MGREWRDGWTDGWIDGWLDRHVRKNCVCMFRLLLDSGFLKAGIPPKIYHHAGILCALVYGNR